MSVKPILPCEEGPDRDLVGGVQHAGRDPAGEAGLAGQGQAAEGVRVGPLEFKPADCGQVESLDRGPAPGRPVEGEGDRNPHVGVTEVGQRRPVTQVDQRVDDRLRVDHHVDPFVVDGQTGDEPRSSRSPCSSALPSRS